MTEREACSRLIEQWEARARKAFPTDAMLINRHIRELHEALAQPVAAEPKQDPDRFDDRKDAERYRWLREEAQYFSIGRAPAVVLCDEHDLLEKGKTPCEPDGWGFISGGRLDAAIDAARAARPTPA